MSFWIAKKPKHIEMLTSLLIQYKEVWNARKKVGLIETQTAVFRWNLLPIDM